MSAEETVSKEKKTRHSISAAERRVICIIKRDNDEWKHTQVAEEASKQLKRNIDRTIVSRILVNMDKWLASNDQGTLRKRQRKPQYEELETRLQAFLQQVISWDAIYLLCEWKYGP